MTAADYGNREVSPMIEIIFGIIGVILIAIAYILDISWLLLLAQFFITWIVVSLIKTKLSEKK